MINKQEVRFSPDLLFVKQGGELSYLQLIGQRLNRSKFVDLCAILWYTITQVHN